MRIGVLAVQGDFAKHLEMLQRCGVDAVEVRSPEQLKDVDGLIIPGGESTTVGKLMARYGIDKAIIERVEQGMPVFGTCTGMILMSREIEGSDQHRLGLMDIAVRRNAFGRQVDSFEADLAVPEVGDDPVRAVFIRAPFVTETRNNVQVLGKVEDKIVFIREGNCLAAAFHPELTDDCRVHEYFVKMVEDSRK
jgi:5'-phosphate synthase pdxT subunit